MELLKKYLLISIVVGTCSVSAIQVTPGSRCADYCLDSAGGNQFKASDSNTNTTDIICHDTDYSTTDIGIKFKACLDCLQSSTTVDQGESDLKWYIYNLRYTISTCLFAVPRAVSNGTVAAKCNIDKVCKSLKEPLTGDELIPNTSNAFSYCTANDGAFMGSGLESCIDCLQDTLDETYISNFLIALEAGCRQHPKDGQILSLSGSVFSTNAINTTAPPPPRDLYSSGSLSPSAIAGICIGVVVLFVVALSLLTAHFRRERMRDEQDWSYYNGNHPSLPGSLPYSGQAQSMSHADRRYYTGNAFGEKPAHGSAGEYYDRIQTELRDGKFSYKPAAHQPAGDAHSQGSSTARPSSEPHNVKATSSVAGTQSLPRTPSPSLKARKEHRSNTPDSFAVRQYIRAAEESAKLTPYRQQQPIPVTQVADPAPKRSSLSSLLTLPSISKLRLSRRGGPKPVKPTTPPANNETFEMEISVPANREDVRFQDRPIGDRIVYAPNPVPPTLQVGPREQHVWYDGYYEVPIRSGKSTLYG